MDQLLEKLFESTAKVKILRLFLRNHDLFFTLADVARSTQLRPNQVQKEVKKLENFELLKKKISSFREEAPIKSRTPKKWKPRITKKLVYFANQDFLLYKTLRDLIAVASQPSRKKLTERIKRLGTVKLAVIAGIFINNDNSRADLFVVGDNIKKKKLEKLLADIESETGKALNYVFMETSEFKYRMNMYDRFLRDIIEFPHQKLINKLNI